jgi:hypothetical protein
VLIRFPVDRRQLFVSLSGIPFPHSSFFLLREAAMRRNQFAEHGQIADEKRIMSA